MELLRNKTVLQAMTAMESTVVVVDQCLLAADDECNKDDAVALQELFFVLNLLLVRCSGHLDVGLKS